MKTFTDRIVTDGECSLSTHHVIAYLFDVGARVHGAISGDAEGRSLIEQKVTVTIEGFFFGHVASLA